MNPNISTIAMAGVRDGPYFRPGQTWNIEKLQSLYVHSYPPLAAKETYIYTYIYFSITEFKE